MRQMLIAAGCLIATVPLGWMAANTASSSAKGKEPRFSQLTLEQLNNQQRLLGEIGAIVRNKRPQGSPSLKGGSLSAGTPASAIARIMATPT